MWNPQYLKHQQTIPCFAVFLLILFNPVMGLALTLIEWDRNPDGQQVTHYELYVCQTAPTCSPLVGQQRLGVNVPQPPLSVGVGAIQRVSMPWPSTAPLVGRISAVAVDLFGNKSVESVIVPFLAQPLPAPKGLSIR